MSEITDLTAAINRLAAAIEASNMPVKLNFSAQPKNSPKRHPAQDLPAPRGYRCALGCHEIPGATHGIAVHDEAGCTIEGCDCPAPFGRIMPQSDVPDDLSSL